MMNAAHTRAPNTAIVRVRFLVSLFMCTSCISCRIGSIDAMLQAAKRRTSAVRSNAVPLRDELQEE
jgi:hypothetical protein